MRIIKDISLESPFGARKMEAVVVLGVAATVAILFYKFVDRRHKIVLLKVVIGISLVVGIGIGCFVGWDSWSKSRKKKWISIEYSYATSYQRVSEKVRNDFALEAFERLKRDNGWRLKGLSDAQLSSVRSLMLSSFLSGKQNDYSEIVGFSKEEDDLSWQIISADFKEDATDAEAAEKVKDSPELIAKKKRAEELAAERIGRYKKDISSWPSKDPFKPFVLWAWTRSVDSDEQKRALTTSAPEEYRDAPQWVAQLEKGAERSIRSSMNAVPAIEIDLGFKICNRREVPLNSVEFSVSGFDDGRSTAHQLLKGEPVGIRDRTDFKSDIIVAPGKCTTPSWTGRYQFFDRYEIRKVEGAWADGETVWDYR